MSENETVNVSVNAENRNTGTPDFLIVEIKSPSGEVLGKVIVSAKTFSSGREGFFAQVQAFVLSGKVYGGQIQIWEKTPKK